MQRFIVSDVIFVFERLLSGLAIECWPDTNSDGSPEDIQRTNETVSRTLDAFCVSSSPVASSYDAFSVLEKLSSSVCETPLASLVSRELSIGNSQLDSFPAASFAELISRLPARDQARIEHRAQLRAQAYRAHIAWEVEQMQQFCAEPHTLQEVNKELQSLLESRIKACNDAVLSAASEASEIWALVSSSQGRREQWCELGIQYVGIVTQKTKTTLSYLQDWVTIRLQADLIETESPSFFDHLNALVALRARWIEQLQRDDTELVGKISNTFGISAQNATGLC